jgi:hypothetical protein
MKKIIDFKSKNLIFLSVVLSGLLLRIFMAKQGHSIDTEHFRFLADYKKYNGHLWEFGSNGYGPIWVHVLYFLDKIYFFSLDEFYSLKWKIVIFLSIVDLFIFFLLFKNYSLNIATLFFLNPISIYVTGFHTGFENFAILIGFVAIVCYSKIKNDLGFVLCLILLGLSIATKHILFLLPLWLAIKEKTWLRKFLMAFIPVAIFLISFLPWWSEESLFIIRHVFSYESQNNGIFWSLFTPQFFNSYIGYKNLFIIALFITGFIFERKNKLETFYLYLLCFFMFSAATANQYFSIPLIAIAVFFNSYFLIFSVCAFTFFLAEDSGLNLIELRELFNYTRNHIDFYYKILVGIFVIAFIRHLLTAKKFYSYINLIFKSIIKKILDQIKVKLY